MTDPLGGQVRDVDAGLRDAEEEIVSSIRKVMRAADSHSRHLRDNFGLTAPQLLVLRELERNPSPTAGQLSRAVHFGQPTVKVILDRLQSLGLVEREADASDRRSLRIRLTEAGGDLVRRAPPLLTDRFRRRLSELEDWERGLVVAVMKRVASMMDVDEVDSESAPSEENDGSL